MAIRIQLTPEEVAFIRERIRQYPVEMPPTQQELANDVRRHDALPLYLGWTETLGIRPDGALVRWTTEDWSGATDFDETTWRNIALVSGARRYPELARLIPSRPSDAIACESCGGAGHLPGVPPTIMCKCAGLGWLSPGTP